MRIKWFVKEHNRMSKPDQYLVSNPDLSSQSPAQSPLCCSIMASSMSTKERVKWKCSTPYQYMLLSFDLVCRPWPINVQNDMFQSTSQCAMKKKWKNMMSSSTTIGINQCQFHVLFFFFFFFFFFFQSSEALQFPEGLLLYACTIADILERYFKPIPTKLL